MENTDVVDNNVSEDKNSYNNQRNKVSFDNTHYKEIMRKFNLPKKICKRDNRIVDFDIIRIKDSISKAMIASASYNENLLNTVINSVLETISNVFINKIPKVEEIQDIIEVSLMKNGLFNVSKTYILYRNKKAEIRKQKKSLLNKSQLDSVEKKFSLNSLKVLASRYLLKDGKGNFAETLSQLFLRVALTSTLAEIGYDKRIFSKEPLSESDLGYDKNESIKKINSFIDHYDSYDNSFSIGTIKLNKFHFRSLLNLIKHHIKTNHLKVSTDQFMDLLKNNEFSEYKDKIINVYNHLINQDFMPNTPALINAGRKLGMLSACFTLNIDDDMESILTAAHDVAIIQKAGGGNGLNFSKLRPKNDVVGSTMGVSSGPVSFMYLINAVSEVIKQGGVRRGANMGILNVNHPDIEEFIKSKEKDGDLNNFNISVGTDSDFWDALYNNKSLNLINPRNNSVFKTINPKELLDLIAYFAWSTADPGMLFFDNINQRNVLINAKGGRMDVTNPCGEEPLYPYESCNLASINLANFVKYDNDGKAIFDWDGYHNVTRLVARILDNMIDVNDYPLDKIDYNTKLTRRIGVGLMGLAEALFKLKIKYNSLEAYRFMAKVAEHLTYYSYVESIELSKERGSFPLYDKSDYVNGNLPIEGFYDQSSWSLNWTDLVSEIKKNGLRNAMVTTNPPTGSVSMIADTTSGIEPIFALVFEKRVLVGNFYYVDPVFEEELKKRGLYNEALLNKISENYGSIQGLDEIPDDLKKIFVTSMDIHWLDHIIAQSTLQRWITDSISKTINLPTDASVEDVKSVYVIAHDLKCKGITVYRDGSKQGQVLNITTEVKKKSFKPEPSTHALKLLNNCIKNNPKIKDIVNLSSLKDNNVLKLNVFIDSSEKNNQQGKQVKQNNKENHHHKVNKPKNKDEVCPICGTKLVYESGCNICPNCGWSECLIS